MRWYPILACVLFLGGCPSTDINFPDVLSVDAMDGTTVVESVEINELEETQFDTDIPVGASFVIHFDETMDFASAEANIWIEDQLRTHLDVDLRARLQDITVTPAMGDLEPGQNHVLHVGHEMVDIAGNGLVNGCDISFYTAP